MEEEPQRNNGKHLIEASRILLAQSRERLYATDNLIIVTMETIKRREREQSEQPSYQEGLPR